MQAPLKLFEHLRDLSKAKAFNKSWDWVENSLAGSRVFLKDRVSPVAITFETTTPIFAAIC